MVTSLLVVSQAAANAVVSPAQIDWEHYKEQLPHLDIDAIRADLEKHLSLIPDIEYNEEADLKEHALQEAEFDEIAHYARMRAAELRELQEESEDHKLDEDYTVARAMQRFEGLFEQEWNEFQKLNLDRSLRTFNEVPDHATPEDRLRVRQAIADRLGLPLSEVPDQDEQPRA